MGKHELKCYLNNNNLFLFIVHVSLARRRQRSGIDIDHYTGSLIPAVISARAQRAIADIV